MALRGVVTSNRAGSAGTASVEIATFPVGTVVGDRIVVGANINNGTSTLVATAGANTWTATVGPTDPVAATERAYGYVRVLDAVDVAAGAVTFTWSGTGTPGRIQCGGLVFTAGDTATPFGTLVTSTSALNTATAPALTTGTPNADVAMLILARVAASNFTGVVVVPAAYTEDYDVITTVATNANSEVSVAHLTTPTTAGSSVGGGSLTSASQATHWVIYMVELRTAITLPADTGTGTDAFATTATVPQTDTAAGTDALTLTATTPLTDTATGADNVTVAATTTASDTAAAADTMTVSATAIASDTGSGADALTLTATTPISDTGAGSDSLAIAATASFDDVAAADDGFSVLVLVDLSDDGAGVEAFSRQRRTPPASLRTSTVLADTRASAVAVESRTSIVPADHRSSP